MNKLRSGQLFAILFIVRLFSFLCATTAFSAAQVGGCVLSTAVQALLLFPIIRRKSKVRPCIGNHPMLWAYALFFVFWGGRTLLQLWEVTCDIPFPVGSPLFAAVVLAAVCLYAARLGMQALARSSTIIFGILLLALTILMFGAYRHAEFSRLFPATNQGILQAAWQDLCNSGELVAAVILCDFISHRRAHGIYSALLGKLAAISLLSVLGIAVLGRISALATYPFFTLGAFSQPLDAQRADAIYLVVFTLLGIVSITTQMILAGHILKTRIPACRYCTAIPALAILLLAGGMYALGTLLSNTAGILIILLTAVIPILLQIWRRKNETTSHSAPTHLPAARGLHQGNGGT